MLNVLDDLCVDHIFVHFFPNLSSAKHDVIKEMGFGGLLNLGCEDFKYVLSNWKTQV